MLSKYPAPLADAASAPNSPIRLLLPENRCHLRERDCEARVLVRERSLHAKGGQGSSSGGSALFSAKAKSRSTGARPSSSATATPSMVRPHPRPTCAFCNTCQLCRADSQATCDLCRQCVLCTPAN